MLNVYCRFGPTLLFISLVLFVIATPLSISLTNISIGIGLVALIASIFYRKFQKNFMMKPVLSISIWSAVTSMFSKYPVKSILGSQVYWHFIPYFLSSCIYPKFKEKTKLLIYLLFISSIIASFGVLFNASTGMRPQHTNFSHLHFLSSLMPAQGFFSNALTTSGHLCITLTLSVYLFLFSKDKKLRNFSILTSIFLFCGFILTGERMYIFSFALLFMFIFCLKGIRYLIIGIVIEVLAFGSVYFLVPSIKNKLNTVKNIQETSTYKDRIALWKAALYRFKDENLFRKLVGCGDGMVFENIKPYLTKSIKGVYGENVNVKTHYHSALHSEPLQILTKWGILGFIIWVLVWIYYYLNVFKLYKLKEKDDFSHLAIGISIALLSFHIGGLTEHNFGDAEIVMYVMFLLGFSSGIINAKLN